MVRSCHSAQHTVHAPSAIQNVGWHLSHAWQFLLQRSPEQALLFDPVCCLASAGDGFIDAKDLRSFLGPAANVEKLIKQARIVP